MFITGLHFILKIVKQKSFHVFACRGARWSRESGSWCGLIWTRARRNFLSVWFKKYLHSFLSAKVG